MYTLFRHANTTGQPIMRPLWFDFPEVSATYDVEDEFMLGPSLLVNRDPLWQQLLAAEGFGCPRGHVMSTHACKHVPI